MAAETNDHGLSLGEIIQWDLAAFYRDPALRLRRVPLGKFLRAYLDIDFRIVFWLRVCAALSNGDWKPLGLLIYFRMKSRYSVDLSPWAWIGPGLRLMHAYDITIGPEVVIGRECILFNGVTLGNSRPDILSNRMPVVGNRCILGTGAKVLGGLRIGDDVLVGANMVVRGDLIPGTVEFERLVEEDQVRVRKDSDGHGFHDPNA